MQWTNSKNRVLKIKKNASWKHFSRHCSLLHEDLWISVQALFQNHCTKLEPPTLIQACMYLLLPTETKNDETSSWRGSTKRFPFFKWKSHTFPTSFIGYGRFVRKKWQPSTTAPRGYQLLNVGWGPLSCTDCWVFVHMFWQFFLLFFGSGLGSGWSWDIKLKRAEI